MRLWLFSKDIENDVLLSHVWIGLSYATFTLVTETWTLKFIIVSTLTSRYLLQTDNVWKNVYVNMRFPFVLHTFSLGKRSLRVHFIGVKAKAKSDVAWNKYVVFLVLCLHWVATKIKESFRFRSNKIGP